MSFLGDDFPEMKLVFRPFGIAWLVFYFLFLLYAAANTHWFPDHRLRQSHHSRRRPFFLQLVRRHYKDSRRHARRTIVPLLCFAYFWWKRETTAVAFCSFWFFENFLYIGTYMSDARVVSIAARRLPTIATGRFFSHNGASSSTISKLAHTMRVLGWLGMLATVAWLA